MRREKKILLMMTWLLVMVVVGTGQLVLAKEDESVYRVGIGEEPTTVNFWAAMGPAGSTMFNFIVQNGYYASLYGYVESTWAFVPTLAEDLPGPILPDGEYYSATIKLQQGLYWSAGMPFTADDVVFTFSTLIDLGLRGNWQIYHPKSLERVEKVDDYTVKFVFRGEPGLAEWNYGVLMCPILPVAQWGLVVEEAKKQPDPAEYLYTYEVTDPVTLGGFDFGKWEPGVYWQNVAADYYTPDGEMRIYQNGRVELDSLAWSWAGVAEAGSPLVQTLEVGPHVDSVLYRLYTNQESMVMALEKGEIDFMLSHQGLTKGYLERLGKNRDVEIVSNPSNSWKYLAFNRERYAFQFVEFHQAVATLIDRDFVAQEVLHGACLSTASVIPAANAFWHNSEIPVYGHGMSRAERVQEAMRLLEQAGFSWVTRPTVDLTTDSFTPGEGLILPNGEEMEPFVIMTPPNSYDPMRATFGLYIQYWLQDLGIPALTKPIPFSLITRKVFEEKDFDAYILSWGLGGTYPDYLYQFFATHGGFNVNGFSDPVFDRLIEEFKDAKDLQVAREIAMEAQARLAETLPYIILYTNPVYDAYRKDRVEYPFTDALDGIQGLYGMPGMVKIIQ